MTTHNDQPDAEVATVLLHLNLCLDIGPDGDGLDETVWRWLTAHGVSFDAVADYEAI